MAKNIKKTADEEFKKEWEKHLKDLMKEVCPNFEFNNMELRFLENWEPHGSIDEMFEQIGKIAKNIISIREKYGEYATGILIEDGGYKTVLGFGTLSLAKSADIKTAVFIKIDYDKITLVENIGSFQKDDLTENVVGRKRLIFLKDIVFLNIGYKDRVRSKRDISLYEDKGFEFNLTDAYENKHGVELSLINGLNFKIIFDDKDNEELLFNKWKEYKENLKKNNFCDNLINYADLYEKGLLTEEEFSALKKELLGLK